MTTETRTGLDPAIAHAVSGFAEELAKNLGKLDQTCLLAGFRDAQDIIAGGKEAMRGIAEFAEGNRVSGEPRDYRIGYNLAFMIEVALERSAR